MDFLTFDILVIDNTALVSGFNLNLVLTQNPDLEIYMTDLVYEEAEKNPKSSIVIQIAESQGILHVMGADPEILQQVDNIAQKSGDVGALSTPDKSLIALTQELRTKNPELSVVLMSDDYSVQNTCAFFSPPIRTYSYSKAGIKRRFRWKVYCPFCRKTFSPEKLGSLCPDCGVELKRKKKKQPSNQK
jgi:rRNA maturation endonuclease Nob1